MKDATDTMAVINVERARERLVRLVRLVSRGWGSRPRPVELELSTASCSQLKNVPRPKGSDSSVIEKREERAFDGDGRGDPRVNREGSTRYIHVCNYSTSRRIHVRIPLPAMGLILKKGDTCTYIQM